MLLVCGLAVPVATATAQAPGPRIVEVYPNPTTSYDVGEYVVVSFPRPTNLSGWTLTDTKTTARLPNATVQGRVAFSRDPRYARMMTDAPVVELTDHLALAQDGDTVQLRYEGAVIDETTYGRAPSAHRWLRTDDGWEWRPQGATAFEARTLPIGEVEAFALPDAPEVHLAHVQSAEDRILLAGYTLSSPELVAELQAAAARGVRVRVLVDGTPVGGQTRAEAEALDALVRYGVSVRVFDGDRKRYRFHHAKYAVVDDRMIVLTENWKPSGAGGRSSRGWGVAVESREVADEAAAVFEADAGWKDTRSWLGYRQGRTFVESEPANGTYPAAFQSQRLPADSVRVIVAPDNAEPELLALIEGAERSIHIQQVTIADRDFPLLRATVNAAERGVRVRILLDRSWYVREHNREFARGLNAYAAANDLPLEVRLVEPRSRFEKVHTKGVIVDERRVVIGSINWNDNSLRNNRELALVVEGEEVGAYYASLFRADWRGGRWYLPVEFGASVALAAVGAGVVARRAIRFEG